MVEGSKLCSGSRLFKVCFYYVTTFIFLISVFKVAYQLCYTKLHLHQKTPDVECHDAFWDFLKLHQKVQEDDQSSLSGTFNICLLCISEMRDEDGGKRKKLKM